MNNEDKVTLTFTVGEIKEMLLPLYEFSIFNMIRSDEDIDNPKWLQGQMRIYGRLLNAVEGGDDDFCKHGERKGGETESEDE